jgi:5'(3')-deoxyribonucleotidase
MAKQVIAIDVDDVLALNAHAFTAYSNKHYGTNLHWSDYRDEWNKLWDVDHATIAQRGLEFHDSGAIAEYEHIAEALPVLQELKERYSLVVITSRRKRIYQVTLDWIEKYFPNIFDEIHFAGIFDDYKESSYTETKLDMCRSVGASYLIDDLTKHCFAAADGGIQAVLFGNYKWNQADVLPEGVTRCNDWQAVREYFDAK